MWEKPQPDELFKYFVKALKAGCSPEVIRQELEAAVRHQRALYVLGIWTIQDVNDINFGGGSDA
jgi:hypothetical protein